MTLDGFLTALALAAAIYAVVPPIQRLRALLAMWLQIPFAVGALGFTLYLEYFKYVGQPCRLSSTWICNLLVVDAPHRIEPKDAAFFVVFIWMFVAFLIHKLARPGASALADMRRLVDELNYEQRYAELIGFIQPHLPFVKAASQRRLPLQRLSDQLDIWRGRYTSNGAWRRLVNREPAKPHAGWAIWRRALPTIGRLGRLVPNQKNAEEAAGDIVRLLLEAPGLQKFLWETRPYFGIRLLQVDNFRSAEYCYSYLTGLIRRPNSVLYFEIEHNQNLIEGRRYALPERNQLLHFLFSDARRAEKLSAWKPIGDHALRVLRPDGNDAYLARLNRLPHEFDIERFKDPVCVAVSFFDIMITEAAFQGVEWHMWLYYFPDIMRGLVDNYDDLNGEIDPTDEFPTFGCRVIYEMIDVMGGWTKMVSDLPANSPHRNVKPGLRGDNGNIPKSAAIALGRTMVHVVMSEKLPECFIRYMVECVARDIRALYPEGDQARMRVALIQAVAHGGASRNGQYPRRLLNYVNLLDPLLVAELEDFVEVIGQASR